MNDITNYYLKKWLFNFIFKTPKCYYKKKIGRSMRIKSVEQMGSVYYILFL